MGFLTRLFGQSGKVKFEATTLKGRQVIKGSCPFEAFNISNAELEERLQRELEFELGEPVYNFRLVDMILY